MLEVAVILLAVALMVAMYLQDRINHATIKVLEETTNIVNQLISLLEEVTKEED